MEERRYLEEDFGSYLKELLEMDCLDEPAKGIAKYAVDSGYGKLSDKQKFTG